MKPVEDLVEELQQEALEYLDNGPIDYSSIIYYDNLYTVCYDKVIDNLTALAEERADEQKYEEIICKKN